jgi:hypothetical protein
MSNTRSAGRQAVQMGNDVYGFHPEFLLYPA